MRISVIVDALLSMYSMYRKISLMWISNPPPIERDISVSIRPITYYLLVGSPSLTIVPKGTCYSLTIVSSLNVVLVRCNFYQ